jgi:DNA repair exonuclease SbcCD ATPase subunit
MAGQSQNLSDSIQTKYDRLKMLRKIMSETQHLPKGSLLDSLVSEIEAELDSGKSVKTLLSDLQTLQTNNQELNQTIEKLRKELQDRTPDDMSIQECIPNGSKRSGCLTLILGIWSIIVTYLLVKGHWGAS